MNTVVLGARERHASAAVHADRVRGWIEPFLARRARGEKHPVQDFLFTYYSFRPSHLLHWSPGLGVAVTGDESELAKLWPGAPAEAILREGSGTAATFTLDPQRYPEKRRESLRQSIAIMQATASRAPSFHCHGLHEWAMVYEADEVRHGETPLRLPRHEIAEVVRGSRLGCTHYDAFRFFTAPARPLNRIQLSREVQAEHEQPGCLHANMDLYKWAYKLFPWIPSDLIADAFALAWRIRELDMRASPYDLAAWGYSAVPLETPAGRDEYEAAQRAFAAEAGPLRQRLHTFAVRLLT